MSSRIEKMKNTVCYKMESRISLYIMKCHIQHLSSEISDLARKELRLSGATRERNMHLIIIDNVKSTRQEIDE